MAKKAAAKVSMMTQISSLAKEIRAKAPTKKWTDCIKEASKQLKK